MKVKFEILYCIDGIPRIEHIEWSRRTTLLVSDFEFGSDDAIAISEANHPDMPAKINTDIAAFCDSSVSMWGDDAAASAIGLLWCIARLTLACSGSDGNARLTVTRGGMKITCETIPG